ncbi:response regulator [bacterium]|nr:response regulator [bacterium]
MARPDPNILLVDDDQVDVMIARRTLARRGKGDCLVVARDGIEALEILRGQNGHAPLPRPCIVLLDLNMPRMDGLEFLRELRADPELSSVVVFALTTSTASRDRAEAYRHQVAGYIAKTGAPGGFEKIAHMIEQYAELNVFP